MNELSIAATTMNVTTYVFARSKFEKMKTYEGDVVKRFMNLVALQPLVVDEAFMPHMKAMDVPFHTMYGSLICFKGYRVTDQNVEDSWLRAARPQNTFK